MLEFQIYDSDANYLGEYSKWAVALVAAKEMATCAYDTMIDERGRGENSGTVVRLEDAAYFVGASVEGSDEPCELIVQCLPDNVVNVITKPVTKIIQGRAVEDNPWPRINRLRKQLGEKI